MSEPKSMFEQQAFILKPYQNNDDVAEVKSSIVGPPYNKATDAWEDTKRAHGTFRGKFLGATFRLTGTIFFTGKL